MDLKEGPKVTTVEEKMYGQFTAEAIVLIPQWRQRLASDPGSLAELEPEVHAAFARGADLVVAGLIAMVVVSPSLQAAGEQTRRGFAYPLARGRERTVRIRLLGGLLIWLSSFYCEPKKGLFRKAHPDAQGMYVELAQFGFTKFESPALQSRVARQAALCPSAHEAEPPSGETQGRSKVKPRRTFKTQWREPKLAIIFVHDEHGRMVGSVKATVEGTFQGPDAITELVAMYLHRLGAAQAETVTFVADRAPWIWDRIAAR